MKFFPLLLTLWGLNDNRKHITIKFFEAFNTFGYTLAKDLIELLDKYDLRKKIIPYVKNEIFNLNTMIINLKSIVSCDILSLVESF
jgi:hypothetical protein